MVCAVQVVGESHYPIVSHMLVPNSHQRLADSLVRAVDHWQATCHDRFSAKIPTDLILTACPPNILLSLDQASSYTPSTCFIPQSLNVDNSTTRNARRSLRIDVECPFGVDSVSTIFELDVHPRRLGDRWQGHPCEADSEGWPNRRRDAPWFSAVRKGMWSCESSHWRIHPPK